MTLKELTYNENHKLNNLMKIFQALTLNCEIKENTSQFEVISQICYDMRPEILIHSYSFTELQRILKVMHKCKICGYEIIPSISNLGIIDTFNIEEDEDIYEILKYKIKKSFKYFFIGELSGKKTVITFNPLIKYKDIVNFIVSNDLKYSCHFIQIGKISLTRSLSIMDKEEGENYKLILYDIEC